MANEHRLWQPALFSALGLGFDNDDYLETGVHIRWWSDARLGLPHRANGINHGHYKVHTLKKGHKSLSALNLFTDPLGFVPLHRSTDEPDRNRALYNANAVSK